MPLMQNDLQFFLNLRMLPFKKLTGMVPIRLSDEMEVGVLKINFKS